MKYAIRIPANDSLERAIAELLARPVGRPSHKPVVRYKRFRYQVTTLETDSRAVVRLYNANEVRVWLLQAEGHLTRRLFGAILRRLEALPGPAG